MGLCKAFEVAYFVSLESFTPEHDDNCKCPDVHEGVDHKISHHTGKTFIICSDDSEEGVACMSNRGVGEHSLNVCL